MPDEKKPKGKEEPKAPAKPDAPKKGDDKGNGGKDGISRKVMASRYGFALAFMNSDPELKKLFNQAVKQTWTADKFIARLRNTDWFKQNSANVRNAILQEKADPATYQANLDQMFATVRDTWGSMFGEADMDEGSLRAWAETAHRMGWSEAQLMDQMTKSVDYRKMLTANALGGTAAETKGQIDTLLSNYGIKMGEQWKAAQLEKLVEGNDTVDGLRQRIVEMSMKEYAAFADRIQAGESVMEIADPYVQRMADLLEMNPAEVGVHNDLIQKALKQRSPDGKPAAMDLWSFEKEVRADTRWQYTKNAHEEVAGITNGLLKQFGVVS